LEVLALCFLMKTKTRMHLPVQTVLTSYCRKSITFAMVEYLACMSNNWCMFFQNSKLKELQLWAKQNFQPHFKFFNQQLGLRKSIITW
jgi:hypothetical protein